MKWEWFNKSVKQIQGNLPLLKAGKKFELIGIRRNKS